MENQIIKTVIKILNLNNIEVCDYEALMNIKIKKLYKDNYAINIDFILSDKSLVLYEKTDIIPMIRKKWATKLFIN